MSQSEEADELSMISGGVQSSLQAMQSLFELQENNQLCDAHILLDDGTNIPIHRAILCSCSLYFKSLFTATLHGRAKPKVKLPGVSSEMMRAILSYIYLRKLDVTEENIYHLIKTADNLSILGILDICCDFLESTLSPKNCIGIILFARSHLYRKLAEQAWKYIMRHFVLVAVQSTELLDLELNDLREIINDDDLNVKCEDTVWNVILRWINQSPDDRKRNIVPLLKCVRLGLLDTQYFIESIKEHPYVTACDDTRLIIMETLLFRYDLATISTRDSEMHTPEIARPRVPHEMLFAVGGWSGGRPTNYMETYDTRADRWIKVGEVDPMGPRAYHGTAVVGFNIYVIGGLDGVQHFSSCRCFDAVQKTWREVAPMHIRRSYVCAAVHDELIYAMGGYNGHRRQKTSEKYDPKSNQWTFIAPMNTPRSDASACALNGKIYVTGGFSGEFYLETAEMYDPVLNQWMLINSMRWRRSGVSCIAYHGHVYVLGGFDGVSRLTSGEKFNPETNSWSEIPSMYNPRSNFPIAVIDDMIFVIGGYNGVTTTYHVECYDESLNEWFEATDMNIYRSALSACVISGLPNVRDYIHKNRENLLEEKRQRTKALESQLALNNNGIGEELQQLSALQQLIENLQDPVITNEINVIEVEDEDIVDES